MSPKVLIVAQYEDNYSYLLCADDGSCAVIDPYEVAPLRSHIQEGFLRLKAILNTHHHHDHTEGNLALKKEYGVRVYASADDEKRIPGFDVGLHDGDEVPVLDDLNIRVLATPGHTRSHILFHLPDSGCLFTGDTLFLLGCGRIFDGDAHSLYKSLQRIAALPDETRIYCGHEYTLKNGEFAESVLGQDDPGLKAVLEKYKQRRRRGEATVPGILGEEKRANPFLRVNESKVKLRLGMSEDSDPADVFARLRELRNRF